MMVKAFEWHHEIVHGDPVGKRGFGPCEDIAAGVRAYHVVAGMVIMCIVAAAARKGQELQRVEYIGIYWHFVDIVWIFLFPLLYIAK